MMGKSPVLRFFPASLMLWRQPDCPAMSFSSDFEDTSNHLYRMSGAYHGGPAISGCWCRLKGERKNTENLKIQEWDIHRYTTPCKPPKTRAGRNAGVPRGAHQSDPHQGGVMKLNKQKIVDHAIAFTLSFLSGLAVWLLTG